MCKTLNPSNLFHRAVLQNGLQKLMQKLIRLKPTPPKGIAKIDAKVDYIETYSTKRDCE